MTSNLIESLKWLPPFTVSRRSSDAEWLKLAYDHAAASPDPSTKHGSILVDNNKQIISYGKNAFPHSIAATKKRLMDRQTKYKMVVHAEACAILNAAKHGSPTNKSILYCPGYACADCAKTMIQAGIRKAVGHAQFLDLTPSRWRDSVISGWEMLQEAGVICVLYDGYLGKIAYCDHNQVEV